ncbi:MULTISPECIES: aromatic amino acid lyase [unclassified Inquilinus]|uniref:aromatic amino acid lyase n=1 Tax=unclassified Inquilinus TaxID=2645927 RepID=UPI003F8EE227
MPDRFASVCTKFLLLALTLLAVSMAPRSLRALEAPGTYQAIVETAADTTITLTGHDLTIEQVIAIARDGAKVKLSDEALQRSADAYGLLLQGAAENVTIYWFNRGAGDQRETVIFSGDPTTPENTKLLKEQQLARFRNGVASGFGPELQEEALIRAIMAIRANTMSYEAPARS